MNARRWHLLGWCVLAIVVIGAMWLRWSVWRENVIGCIEHGADARWCMEHTR